MRIDDRFADRIEAAFCNARNVIEELAIGGVKHPTVAELDNVIEEFQIKKGVR